MIQAEHNSQAQLVRNSPVVGRVSGTETQSPKLLYGICEVLCYRHYSRRVFRPVGQRLRADSLWVWFDEREIKTGDSIPAKIEEGLECSTALFRDPSNASRCFVQRV